MNTIGIRIKTPRQAVYAEYVELAKADAIIDLLGGKYKVMSFGYTTDNPAGYPKVIYDIELQEMLP